MMRQFFKTSARRFIPMVSRPGWTPSLISTAAWYDAYDLSTIVSSGGFVSQWSDKGANGYHMIQPTGGNQPTIGLSTIGGIGVIDFSGADFLYSTGLGATYAGNDIPFAVVGVFKYDARAVTSAVIALDSTIDTDTLYFFGTGGSGTNWRHFRRDDAANSTDISTTAADNNVHILSAVFSGSNLSLLLDGTSVYSVASNLGQFTATHAMMGAILGGGLPADCDIAELVWVGSMTTDVQQKIEGYLAWKWDLVVNLPVGHPYKFAAPLAA